MPEAGVLAATPTRRQVFDPLVALAKARAVALVEAGELDRDDGEFLLRALFDLESDGVELFGAPEAADACFYGRVADYLAARVGSASLAAVALSPRGAEAFAAVATGESSRVAQLLGLPGAVSSRPRLARAVSQLVNHHGGQRVTHKFLVHKGGDHVGVAVVDIGRGEQVQGVFMDDDSTVEVEALDPVPLGHKIAVVALEPDAEVLEYGIPIGTAPDGLTAGAHVHTHNLRSGRW